jgi:hypothetical protein
MRRRLPITSSTAGIIAAWQQHRALLRVPPELDQWLFPSPLRSVRPRRLFCRRPEPVSESV